MLPEPIHRAALTGNEAEVVRLVREDPRRLNAHGAFGETPLMTAVSAGRDSVVARLLALGADVALQGLFRDTAVHRACTRMRPTALALLIDAGAPLNGRDRMGNTPLMEAVRHSAVGCVTVLLTRGRGALELDKAGTGRRTAVHHAASSQQPQILRLLLDAGAHPAILDREGHTPLDLARHADANNPCTPLLEAAISPSLNARLLLKARALADSASDVRIARDNAQSQGSEAQRQAALAAAPAYLKPRVQRGQEMPAVEVNAQDEEEELGACLRFVLGLQGHGGWAGAEDERATMRAQGLFREVFVELAELLVPAWDRADV